MVLKVSYLSANLRCFNQKLQGDCLQLSSSFYVITQQSVVFQNFQFFAGWDIIFVLVRYIKGLYDGWEIRHIFRFPSYFSIESHGNHHIINTTLLILGESGN